MNNNVELDFKTKRILKNKDHVTLNDGDQYEAQVQHLKQKGDKFVELSKQEATKLYADKKITRDINFSSRNGIQEQDKGLGMTPEWFEQVIPTVEWDKYRTFLYELDYLWMNMFFVRELYGEEQTGREQIIELKGFENGDGLTLEVLAQLHYDTDTEEYDLDDVDGFIEVELKSEEKENKQGEKGQEFDYEVDFKHSCFNEDQDEVANGLREILTGICFKHGYEGEKLKFSVQEKEEAFHVKILNKDFTLKFSSKDYLSDSVSPWVVEMFYWDGCPLNPESFEEVTD